MKIRFTQFKIFFIAICLFPILSYADTEYDKCILKEVAASQRSSTIEELRKKCKIKKSQDQTENIVLEIPTDTENSAITKRRSLEIISEELPFILTPHKSNYVLPVAYNLSPNDEPFKERSFDLDNAEVKFQFSVKSRITKDLFFGQGDIWMAYTNLSFWQAYNRGESSLFRETNHEPEIFIDFHPNLKVGDWSNNLLRIGFNHQSNGRENSLSRSWNRLYALATVENGNWYFALKPWYRIPESEKEFPEDTDGDDNPDIHKFLGYGDFLAYYKDENNTIGLTLRNNLRADSNRYGIQLDWTFPLKDKIRGYTQFYSGYGESLIDYDARVHRIGIGIMFSDIL